ncbi:MAG: hypothetical protein KGZ72_05460 [Roseovarius sp.]|jgi:hypothetical protein|nr:hypothetical protein [Roseovarius sp.]
MKVSDLIATLEGAHPDAEVEVEIVLRPYGKGLGERGKSAFGTVSTVMWDDPDKPEGRWGYGVLLLARDGHTGGVSLASRS